jgi:hypothetical protein
MMVMFCWLATAVYSDVTYKVLDSGEILVAAVRFSELKKYSSPLTLRIARHADGHWLIVEETGESQP